MQIIDTHCDTLYKIQKHHEYGMFLHDERLDVNLQRLNSGKIKLQFFAIYVDHRLKGDSAWKVVLKQIEIFKQEIIATNQQMIHIKSWSEIKGLEKNEIGAVLTIEGLDSIVNDLSKLTYLYTIGVLAVGLTWNYASLFAGGALEARNVRLTELGKKVINLNNHNQVLTDLSHLNEQSFFDTLEIAAYPYVSHSNVYVLCPHRRNLTDEQLIALIKRNVPIHLNFYPPFLRGKNATITDIIRHIDYICSLGGVNNVGFGSDFDGIDMYLEDLTHCGQYNHLIEELLKHFSDVEVEKFAGGNFLHYLHHKFR